jgi:hypothetical protein
MITKKEWVLLVANRESVVGKSTITFDPAVEFIKRDNLCVGADRKQ